MKICRAEIENFRSVEHANLDDLSLLNIFVGSNNAGKSTLLQAFRSARHVASWPSGGDALGVVTDGEPSRVLTVNLSVEFDARDVAALDASFKELAPSSLVDFKFGLVPGQQPSPWVPLDISSPSFHFVTDAVNGRWAFTRSGGGATTQGGGGSFFAQELEKEIGAGDRRVELDPLRLLATKSFAYDPYRAPSPQSGLTGIQRLTPQGSNLAHMLSVWLHAGGPEWDAYQALVASLIPGIGRVVVPLVPTTGNITQASVAVRQGERLISTQNLGTGVQQLLALAFHFVAPETQILILEEPESHLHPQAQRALFQAIRHAVAQGKQIFLSTHSPLFVDRWYPSHNWLITLDNNLRTVVTNLEARSDSYGPVRQALGTSIGDSLFVGDAVLIVEGATEQLCIPLLAPLLGASHVGLWERVAVVNAGGAGNVPSLLRIVNGFKVPVVLMVDNDTGGKWAADESIKRGLIGSPAIVYAGDQGGDTSGEFEDELPSATYIAAANDVYNVGLSLADLSSPFPIATACEDWLRAAGILSPADRYRTVDVCLAACQTLAASEGLAPTVMRRVTAILAELLSV